MRTSSSFVVTALALIAAAACSDDSGPTSTIDAPVAGFNVNGTAVAVGGAAIPATSKAAAIWSVSTGTDYLFKFGDGTATSAALNMQLTTDAPAAALNGGAVGFGVAFVALYPSTAATLPDGMVSETQAITGIIGASSRHAIIFKAPGAAQVSWLSAFPDGYSCGVCVDNPAGFDTFTPVACSQLVIDVSTDLGVLDFCNWT
jgi:hypothetical protein